MIARLSINRVKTMENVWMETILIAVSVSLRGKEKIVLQSKILAHCFHLAQILLRANETQMKVSIN